MVRTVDPAAHALRRDAFVDAALRLIQTRGYDQFSLQDVAEATGTSKSALYHYFDTKAALLTAVVEHITETASAAILPIAEERGLSAVEKLNGVFSAAAQWKGERKELILELLRIWLSDGNAPVREQMRHGLAALMKPPLTAIIRQGQAEGSISTSHPEGTAAVLIALMLGANEQFASLFLERQAGTVSFEEVERMADCYEEAFEKVLGLPPGSWTLVDGPTLRAWLG